MTIGYDNCSLNFGLLCDLQCNEGVGTVLNSNSKLHHAAVATGTAWVQLSSGKWVQEMDTDNISLGTDSHFDFTSGAFSIAAWVKTTDLTNINMIFCRGLASTDGYYFYVNTNGALTFSTNQAGAIQTSNSMASLVTTNIWNLLLITRSGASGLVYKNGVDVTGTFGSHTNPLTSARMGYWGKADGAASYLKGQMTNMRIWNRTLAASEAKNLYLSEKSLFGL